LLCGMHRMAGLVDCGGALTFVLGRHDGRLEGFLGSTKMCVFCVSVSLCGKSQEEVGHGGISLWLAAGKLQVTRACIAGSWS